MSDDSRIIVAAIEEMAAGYGSEYGHRFAEPEHAVEWAMGYDTDGDRGHYAAYLRLKNAEPTVDELIRECGDLRWVYVLRNHGTLTTADGQPINEAEVWAMTRGKGFTSRDADPAKALNAAMNGLARVLEMER